MKPLNAIVDILLGWLAIGLTLAGVAVAIPPALLLFIAAFLHSKTIHASKNA